jgi:lipopolysaccharide biosynthesis glycosyltransferase
VRRGCRYFTKDICCQILNKMIWISVSIVFMENIRELDFSKLEKKIRVKR